MSMLLPHCLPTLPMHQHLITLHQLPTIQPLPLITLLPQLLTMPLPQPLTMLLPQSTINQPQSITNQHQFTINLHLPQPTNLPQWWFTNLHISLLPLLQPLTTPNLPPITQPLLTRSPSTLPSLTLMSMLLLMITQRLHSML